MLRAPVPATKDRRLAAVSTFPAAAVLSASIGLARGLDVDQPAWTDAYYRVARGAGVSLGLGVIGCGSVFAGPYRGMIERLRAAGRVHVARRLRRRRPQAPRCRRALRTSTRS